MTVCGKVPLFISNVLAMVVITGFEELAETWARLILQLNSQMYCILVYCKTTLTVQNNNKASNRWMPRTHSWQDMCINKQKSGSSEWRAGLKTSIAASSKTQIGRDGEPCKVLTQEGIRLGLDPYSCYTALGEVGLPLSWDVSRIVPADTMLEIPYIWRIQTTSLN